MSRVEERAPATFTNTVTIDGTLRLNLGEKNFNAPPFVPGLQEGIGVDVLDNHTALHEAVFADVGTNTGIWETDTDNSSAVVGVVGTDTLHGGIKLTTGGSDGHQTALATAATNYQCTTGKPWWIKTRFNLDAHDTVEFFFGVTETAADANSFHLAAAGTGTDRVGFVKAVHNNDAVTFASTLNSAGTISTALDTAQTYDANLSVVSYGIHWDGAGNLRFYSNKVATTVTPGAMTLVHTYSTAAGIPDAKMRLVLMVETGAGSAKNALIEYIKGAYTK